MQKLPYTTFYRINKIFHNHAIIHIYFYLHVEKEIMRSTVVVRLKLITFEITIKRTEALYCYIFVV